MQSLVGLTDDPIRKNGILWGLFITTEWPHGPRAKSIKDFTPPILLAMVADRDRRAYLQKPRKGLYTTGGINSTAQAMNTGGRSFNRKEFVK